MLREDEELLEKYGIAGDHKLVEDALAFLHGKPWFDESFDKEKYLVNLIARKRRGNAPGWNGIFNLNSKFHVMFDWEDSGAEGYDTLDEALKAAKEFGAGRVLVLELKKVLDNNK